MDPTDVGLRRVVSGLLRRAGNAMFTSIAKVNEEREARLTARLEQLERKIVSMMIDQLNRRCYLNPLPSELSEFGYSIFSQFGEDGILWELLNRIPGLEQTFVEFGVEDYQEANTRLLAEVGVWRGLVMDSAASNIAAIRNGSLYWKTNLTALPAFVNAENINSLIKSAGFEGEIGVLSIDIDGNDYWVWQALSVVEPTIVICEYNSIFGRNQSITIPYDPSFVRSDAHYSNLYFGASLRALSDLAESKGYQLVAVEPSGVNAFFVRKSHANRLKALDPLEAYELTPVRESLDNSGQHTFLAGRARLQEIEHLPVIVLPQGRLQLLSELDIEY